MRLELETRRFYLGRDYSEAIEAAGGLPVHIPLIPDEAYIASVVAGLDGILLPGSDTDVDPLRYGEEPHARLKKVIPEKDETDALVLAQAEERNLPVLAICYGMQALNVYRGGTLIQDIEAHGEDTVKHEQGIPLDRASHKLTVERNSLLGDIVNDIHARVNSHHHQAVAIVGRDLEATAWATDGIVEAIEDTRAGRFVLGIQWHPELSWKSDKISGEIFRRFVNECVDRGEKLTDVSIENTTDVEVVRH
jgi:putative glutamine amidotransferase